MSYSFGYSAMAHYRNREFVEYVHELAQGSLKQKRFGELTFRHDTVLSYDAVIGKVWLEDKVIVYNEGYRNFSKTTNRHLGAITRAERDLPEFSFLPAKEKNHINNAPAQLIATLFGSVGQQDVLQFWRWLSTHIDRDKLVKKYISLSPIQREAMRGFLELKFSEEDV